MSNNNDEQHSSGSNTDVKDLYTSDDNKNAEKKSSGSEEDRGHPVADDDGEDDGEEYFPREGGKKDSSDGNKNNDSGNVNTSSGNFHKSKSFAKSFEMKKAGEPIDREGKLRRETALPVLFVIERLRLSVESSLLYSDMLVFFPFLVLFIFFFLAGRDVESNFYVLKGTRDRGFLTEFPTVEAQLRAYRDQVLNNKRLWVEMDKTYTAIANSGDWIDFINVVIVPHLFDCRNPDTRHEFLAPFGQTYNLGAIRLRSQHVRNTSCDVRDDIYTVNGTFFPRECYGPSKGKNELTSPLCNVTNPLFPDKQLFEYKACSEVPGAPIAAIQGVYHCGGHILEIPFNLTCNEARTLANQLYVYRDTCSYVNMWSLRFVLVEWMTYSPVTDTFYSNKFFHEIMPSGWWYNEWLFRAFTIWTKQQVVQTIIDIVFFLFVMYYWFVYIYEAISAQLSGDGCLSYVLDFWNILELANNVCFIVVFVFKFMWWSTSDSASGKLQLPFDSDYPPNLDRLQVLFESQVYANSVNTMLVFLKLLKYVRLNNRLNVLTRTIAACQQSIFGVLVLFITIIFAYAITGWNLFGINIEGFRNLGISMSSLVRMLVGDIDYEQLRRENRFLAGAFFWTFMILALFLLLNFLIAIISESFAQISGRAYAQPLEELLIRYWQGLKMYCRPSNLGRLICNKLTGNSEPKLLRKLIEQLEEVNERETEIKREALKARREALQADIEQGAGQAAQLEALEEEGEEAEALLVTMKYDNFVDFVDEETYDLLSEHFFLYTWDDLMNEYDDSRKSAEEVTKRRMAETVKLGVEKVLGEDIQKIDQLDQVLQNVEGEVNRMLAALDGKAEFDESEYQ